jgi:hypothetical protein
MHPSLLEATTEYDLSAKFWTSAGSSVSGGSFGARNLYELFVHDLSNLVSGACQADRAAHALYACLPSDQIGLRRLALGLARSGRACLPDLPVTLLDEGLVLPPAHEATVGALLATIHPEACGNDFEPWSVVGARIVGVFHKVALHLEAEAIDAAENANLLGSAPLHEALLRWAGTWNDYISELRSREPAFRAQAYAAGLINTSPLWQFA